MSASELIPKTRSYRVGLLGAYGSNNLGDTAIQIAVMEAIRRRIPEARFYGFSWSARDVARTHGIPAFAVSGEGSLIMPKREGNPEVELPLPSRKWIRALLYPMPALFKRMIAIGVVARHLDLLCISGGGQYDEYWGGPFGHPLRLWMWSAWAKLHGASVAVLGVGLCDIRTGIAGAFVIKSLRRTDFRFVRDAGTLQWIRKKGFSGPVALGPDPAFGLRITWPASTSEAPFVAVSPIAREAWPGKPDTEYFHYLDCLAAACNRILELGFAIHFCCSQIRMDVPVISEVLQRMGSVERPCCRIVAIASVAEYCAAVAGAEMMLASRLHGLILAMVSGPPVLAITYSRKVLQLMIDMGFESQSRPLAGLQKDSLLACLDQILSRRSELKLKTADKVGQYRMELDGLYDSLVQTLSRQTRRQRRPWLGDPGGLAPQVGACHRETSMQAGFPV